MTELGGLISHGIFYIYFCRFMVETYLNILCEVYQKTILFYV